MVSFQPAQTCVSLRLPPSSAWAPLSLQDAGQSSGPGTRQMAIPCTSPSLLWDGGADAGSLVVPTCLISPHHQSTGLNAVDVEMGETSEGERNSEKQAGISPHFLRGGMRTPWQCEGEWWTQEGRGSLAKCQTTGVPENSLRGGTGSPGRQAPPRSTNSNEISEGKEVGGSARARAWRVPPHLSLHFLGPAWPTLSPNLSFQAWQAGRRASTGARAPSENGHSFLSHQECY